MKLKNKNKITVLGLGLSLCALLSIAFAHSNRMDAEIAKTSDALPLVWYFNGDDPLEPSDYTLTSGSCGGTPQTVCSIEAPNNGGQPMLGTSQIADIEDALESIENNKPTANGTVKSFRSH